MFKRLLNKIRQHEFVRNVFTMLTGAGISQLLVIIFIPILTRIYTPAEFGIMALFISIANILSVIATGRFELGIMLPKHDENAYNLLFFSLLLIVFVSLICFILIVSLDRFLITRFDLESDYHLFYFLPLSILLISTNKILFHWQNRHKRFKNVSMNKVSQSVTSSITNFTAGFFFHLGATGLLTGHLLSFFVADVLYFFRLRKTDRHLNKSLHPATMRKEIKNNRNFPYYSVPMGIINLISKDVLIYAFKAFYTDAIVGYFNNARKVIDFPLMLLTNSFKSVFFQKLTTSPNPVRIFTYSYFSTLAVSVMAMLPVIFWGEEIFGFVLGDDWREAGKIASLLAPLIIFNFPARNTSNVFSYTRKNQYLLIWQVAYLAVSMTVIFLFKDNFESLVLYYAIAGAILYIILSFMEYFILRKHAAKNEGNG